jgi:glycosyltransferase involved in cell wall biosynthesis
VTVADGLRRIAVAGAADSTGTLVASLSALGYAVAAIAPGDAEGRISPGFLATSYALYQSLRDEPVEAIVFDFDGGLAYCAAAARRLGLAFESAPVVVHCSGSSLRGREPAGRPFLSRNRIGAAVTERLAVELADAVVCDREAYAWFDAQGWSVPGLLAVARPGDALSDTWAAALGGGGPPPAPIAEPLVSVVVPRFERTGYVRHCLEALTRQDYPALEVIVADDGSTSSAAREQLGQLEAEDWPFAFRVLRLEHGGLSATRNAGWRAAAGELVLFVDDDDIPFDDLVRTLVRAGAVSGSDIVVSGARHFRAESLPVPHATDVIKLYLGRPRELGLLSNQYGGPVALWRRATLEQIGGFAELPLLEDWEALARATAVGARVAAVPEPHYWYRLGRGSMFTSGTFRTEERDQGLDAIASAYASQLPADLRLLPRVALGAYEELDRRHRVAAPGRRAALIRLRALVREARKVHAEQGPYAVFRRALRYAARGLR